MCRANYSTINILFLLSMALGLFSCASVSPFGGDGALQLAEDEKRLWNRSREEGRRIDFSGQLYDSKELVDYVNAVADKLIPEDLRKQDFHLTIKILKNPLLNAFALPHGVIYIHSGFLAKIENEAQLAAILSHELVHITHRHALRHFRSVQNTSVAVAALQLATIPLGSYGALANLLGSLSATAAIGGYSRAMESEADTKGFELLVNAGYDPAEAPRLFKYVKAELEDRKISEPFFFGSHPRLAERQENWTALLTEKFAAKSGEKGTERYAEKIDSLLLETAQIDLSFGRWAWAEQTIKRYISLKPQAAEGHFYMGELFRRRGEREDHGTAETEYRTAIQLNSFYAAPYGGLGKIYLTAGNKERAQREFLHYLSLSPQADDRAYIEQYLEESAIPRAPR